MNFSLLFLDRIQDGSTTKAQARATKESEALQAEKTFFCGASIDLWGEKHA